MAVKVVRRTKRVTKKSQTGTLRKVWNGTKMYTVGGLMKKDLCLNKNGKLTTKKRSAAGKKAGKNIQGWTKACMQARKQLGLKGFVACKKGSKYYKLCKELYSQ